MVIRVRDTRIRVKVSDTSVRDTKFTNIMVRDRNKV